MEKKFKFRLVKFLYYNSEEFEVVAKSNNKVGLWKTSQEDVDLKQYICEVQYDETGLPA
jgi:hypothetical protein